MVVRFGRLGDMVLQTPLLHLLHKRYGKPCVLVTSGPWSRELLDGSDDVAEIWQLKHRHRPLLLSPERWKLIRALRVCRGPIYVTEDSARQVGKIRRLFALAGIPRDRCLFITDQSIAERHWVDRLLRFGRMTPPAFAAGNEIAPEDAWKAPRLDIRAADRMDRDAWLREHRITHRALVLVQPGNKRAMKWGRARNDDNKGWPIANWAKLLRTIRASLPGACILLCGSASEEILLEEIRDAAKVDGVNVAARDLPLRRLLAIMEIAHCLISVDTGPSHMAAAIGCPLVVIYGAEPQSVWARRSPTASPIIELGGPPSSCTARDVTPNLVVDAWSCIMNNHRNRR